MRRFWLSVLVVATLSCATTAVGTYETRTGPPSAGERTFSNNEAVEHSTVAIQRAGYSSTGVESVEELGPNFWRIRYGLAPRGSGRLLEVYFDGVKRDVVKTVEVGDADAVAGESP